LNRNYLEKFNYNPSNLETWIQIGSTYVTDSCIHPIKDENGWLSVYNGIPYFAYANDNNSNKIIVKAYINSNWQVIGGDNFSTGNNTFPSLSLWKDNVYLSYISGAGPGSEKMYSVSFVRIYSDSCENVGIFKSFIRPSDVIYSVHPMLIADTLFDKAFLFYDNNYSIFIEKK
jgi:hypothetical protein